MSKPILCKNCDNQFGESNKTKLEINYKRVSNIEYDFETQKISVKCRSCSHYSYITFDDVVTCDVDYKKTASKLLG